MKIYKSTQNSFPFQKFGVANTYPSVMPFYKELGLLGHNGWDFTAKDRTKGYWDCDIRGMVITISTDPNAGYGIIVLTEETEGIFLHIFWHLATDGILCKIGQVLESGDLFFLTDNTGKYTTGPHLHRGLKQVDKRPNGFLETLNYDNGYKGAIDLAPYYVDKFVLDVMAELRQAKSLLQQIIGLWKQLLQLKGR